MIYLYIDDDTRGDNDDDDEVYANLIISCCW